MYSAGGATFELAGGPGEEPDLVDHRRDLFAHGQRERLAGVLALKRDQFFGMLLDGVGDLQQRQ